VSFNSRYDRYAYGDTTALNEQEVRGYNVFRGFVARCSQCHIPPLFTDSELAVIGSPALPGKAPDPGAGGLSSDPSLLGAFRVPTLRNISATAPYFHAGQFKTLNEVVDFYNDNRGHAAPPGEKLKIHWHVHMTRGPEMSKEEEQDIVAFLASLDDQGMTPIVPETAPSGLPVLPALNLETP
jgi:cytochrome c peroxidase